MDIRESSRKLPQWYQSRREWHAGEAPREESKDFPSKSSLVESLIINLINCVMTDPEHYQYRILSAEDLEAIAKILDSICDNVAEVVERGFDSVNERIAIAETRSSEALRNANERRSSTEE
jgi:hypothetical protein